MKAFGIILLIIVAAGGAFAQEWQWENPRPQGNELLAISEHGWAVGRGSTLLHNFAPEPAPIPGDYYAVSQPNDQTCWIACEWPGAIFYKPANARTWTQQYLDSSVCIFDLHMISAQSGWAIAHDQSSDDFLLHTTNGGASWLPLAEPRMSGARSIHFVGSQFGWIGSYDGADYRTTDGGATWTQIQVGYTKFSFVDEMNGWAIQYQTIYHTTDGGETWNAQPYANPVYLLDIQARDFNTAFACGHNTILHTTDSGVNWHVEFANANLDAYLNAVKVYNWQSGWAVGEHGTLIAIDVYGDWGQFNHSVVDRFSGFSAAAFANRDLGWIVGAQGGSGNGLIVRGQWNPGGWWGWFPYATPWATGFTDVAVVDTQTAYAVAGKGGIFATRDGYEWLPLYSGVTYDFSRVNFVDRNHGFVLSPAYNEGGTGHVMVTHDGGASWEDRPFNAPNWTMDMSFPDSHNGWMVGSFSGERCGDGFVMHTTDAGLSWTQQYSTVDTCILSCWFVDAFTGWVSGAPGVIMKTTDGGVSWNAQPTGTNGYLSKIVFTDALHGFAAAGSSYTKTTDGGATWVPGGVPSEPSVSGYAFASDSTGWAVGFDGTILSYHAPASLSSSEARAEIPSTFTFSAYPNPFNPVTTLSFDLPRSGVIEVMVYDISGRLVQTIAHGQYAAGPHTVSFDGSALASGIYFARLHGTSVSRTQKLVLLK